MLSYRPCRHKSYRIGKEELPSLTSALNWSRVLMVWGEVVHQGDRNAEACQTLWQGALRAGKDAWCARCEKPCSYKHLMWECDWWADNLQEPSNFPELRAKYPGEALWTFGLNPQPVQGVRLKKTSYGKVIGKRFAWHHMSISGARNGTAGAGKDPRMQHHVWGVGCCQG